MNMPGRSFGMFRCNRLVPGGARRARTWSLGWIEYLCWKWKPCRHDPIISLPWLLYSLVSLLMIFLCGGSNEQVSWRGLKSMHVATKIMNFQGLSVDQVHILFVRVLSATASVF
jgi:hypothetical protein